MITPHSKSRSLRKHFIAAAAFGSMALVGAPPVWAQTTYQFTALNGSGSLANGLNDSGTVVGTSGYYNAFSYSNGTTTDLGTLGGSSSAAYAINDSGTVVGASYTSSGYQHAFSYTGATMNDLGTLGGNDSFADGINVSGTIVGYAGTSMSSYHAFSYSGSTMTDLGTLGGSFSTAAGINNSGTVVGYSGTASGDYHAFSYSGGIMTDLGTLGGNNSYAAGINSSDTVVGLAQTASGDLHAFSYSGGIMTDLGTLSGGTGSYANAINNSGAIVGYTSNGAAFVYSGGTMSNLNTLAVNLPGGWSLYNAKAINTAGDIVGFGYNTSNQEQAFLLTPITADLYWNNHAGNGLWDTTDKNFNDTLNSIDPTAYSDGSVVNFTDTNGPGGAALPVGAFNVTLNNTLNPASVMINNSAGNYVISGTGSITGSSNLVKEGSDTLTLSTANAYTGGTTIGDGTLTLGASGSIADSATINIQSGATFNVSAVSGGFTLGASTAQTLEGPGNVTGNVTVGAQGTLAPGDAMGTLTVNGSVTLGGTFAAQVDPDNAESPPNGELLTGDSGNVVLGGALNVTTSNADPLTAGSSYTLISAAGDIQNGPGVQTAFSSVTLPVLNAGLSWDTTLLNDNPANYQDNYTISVTNTVPAGFTLGAPLYTAALTPGQSYNGYYIQNLGGRQTDVQFLGGTVSAGTTLAVQFANRSGSNPDMISDVVTISGTNSDTYVLELNYIAGDVTNGTLSPMLAVEHSNVFEAAVLLDPAQHEVAGAYNPSTDDVLGDYGIDPVNHEVWAVLDYSGGDEFGVYQRIPGDLTGSGTVTPSDLGLVATNLFGPTGGLWSRGDFQGTGSPSDTVTPGDLGLVQTNLFATEPMGGTEGPGGGLITSSPVPEPGSLALLATGALGLLVRRRRMKAV